MVNRTNEMLVGCGVVFKESKGKVYFLLVKNNDSKWEILKSIGRKGESSVRAIIRYTTEQGSMDARVLDEVGRFSQSVIINGKAVVQKHLYYLMLFKTGGEMIGFENVSWFDYQGSIKKIKTKKEADMIKKANLYIKNWKKEQKK